VIQQLNNLENGAMKDLATEAQDVLLKARAVEKTLEEESLDIVKAADEHFDAIHEAQTKLNRRINELPTIRVPAVHGMLDLLNIVERCGALTDSQWSRVIALAHALNNKEQSE